MDLLKEELTKNPIVLSPHILDVLIKCGLSGDPKAISLAPDSTFSRYGATKEEIEQIKMYFSKNEILQFRSILDLPDPTFITYGCESLNALANGGIICGQITEISGEAGTGKTQIALQIALNTQLPKNLGGVGKKSVYICTESKFPSSRLEQMIKGMNKKYLKGFKNQIEYSDNILVQHILRPVTLLSCVSTILPRLLSRYEIGVIIIDSIAGIFREETDYIKRSENLRDLSFALSKLTDDHNCAVLITNQVTSVINDENDNDKEELVPCLGLAWSNLIDVRLQILKTAQTVQICDLNEPEIMANVRELEVIFGLKMEKAKFLISSGGLIDVP